MRPASYRRRLRRSTGDDDGETGVVVKGASVPELAEALKALWPTRSVGCAWGRRGVAMWKRIDVADNGAAIAAADVLM